MTKDRTADTSVVTSLFRHNTWASLRLLDFCAGMSDDQLASTAVGTYGSIRATLEHFVFADVDYVHRATEKWPPIEPPTGHFPGFEALKTAARWSGEELERLAVTAHAESTVRETDPEQGLAASYPLSGLLVQAINHGTEHRAQIAAIITQLGVQPPELDSWTWMSETGQFHEEQLPRP